MNTIINLGPSYKDARGSIDMILENQTINSVSIISSEPDTTRAKHWHRADSHYCLVTKGEIHYFEQPIDNPEKITMQVVKEGELFYTPPNVVHEMYFPIQTVFHCYSTLSRTSNDYEKDTTRVDYSLRDLYNK